VADGEFSVEDIERGIAHAEAVGDVGSLAGLRARLAARRLGSLPRQVFDPGWEQQPGLDECPHAWRSVAYRRHDDSVGFVDRCLFCRAPRCQRDGCVDRRHHATVHIFVDGSFEAVGGVLTPEESS
jgi:hypothetical protein